MTQAHGGDTEGRMTRVGFGVPQKLKHDFMSLEAVIEGRLKSNFED